MLSAPIQTSPNTAPMTSAGNDPLLPAAANVADAQSAEAVPEAATFGEQLGDALTLPEALAPELAGEDQPARDGQEQSEPNAEAWLLAMLDQQQLQLQARDTQIPSGTQVQVAGLVPVAPTLNTAATLPTLTPAPTAALANAAPTEKASNAAPLRVNLQPMASK